MGAESAWEELVRYVEVAVALPLAETYTYKLPPSFGDLARGQRLLVPFGPRRVTAFVLAVHDTLPEGLEDVRLKEPIDTLEDETFFDETLLELLAWVSRYYRHPLGEVLAGALPGDTNVASRKVYILTEEGQEAAGREPDALAREVLGHIGSKKAGVTPRQLLARYAALRPGTLAAWERRGWIETHQADRGKRMPTEKVFRCDPKGLDIGMDALSPKARRLLSYVMAQGEATVAELQSNYGSVASSLKTLEKRGLLVPGVREKAHAGYVPDMDLTGTAADDLALNVDQQLAFDRIATDIADQVFAPALLQGVTGSGKTEVYIRLAERALAEGRSVLVLVPEIALTPQLIARFASRLHQPIAVLHSALGSTARFDMFRKAARGEARVVIGARSAVFAPLKNIGLIVVDEEHEHSYKQEEAPRYHARDTALMRGKLSGCPVVLGSATPSLESRYNSDRGRYTRSFLPRRATTQTLARIEVVDLRESLFVDESQFISRPLFDALRETLEAKEQAIIFQNRRGYAPYVICKDCGQFVYCPECSVSLVYHRTRDRLHCHYCAFDTPMPSSCPQCQGVHFKLMGSGTQRVEESLLALFPDARIERMDRDSVSGKDAHQDILSRLSRGEIDILVGTQMLTKGFDFPGITLVGVLLADAGLSMPDFRAAERSFQTLVQVAGRAGRGDRPGRVLFQTMQPENPTLRAAVLQDYERFYAEELGRRRDHGFPPFMRQMRLLVSAPDGREAAAFCVAVFAKLQKLVDEGLRIMGPNPAPVERIKGRFRWHLLLQATKIELLVRAAEIIERMERGKEPQIVLDVDPLSML